MVRDELIAPRPRPPAARARLDWRNPRVRAFVWQALALAAVAMAAVALVQLTLANLRERGIHSGFGFLVDPTGFEIGESLLAFDSTQPYWRALLVGLLNTLRVAAAGIVLATVLGTAVALARLSRNALLRALGYAYVELLRNVPLLLQLLMWYLVLVEGLPEFGEPLQLRGLGELSKAGFNVTALGFNLSTEFMALLLGLTLYTAAFIAEVVRAGLLAVPAGQREAAASLGLSRRQQLRLVVMPQALRVIVPPLTNQYLNLTKNSSLAVAIGYPDVVGIANTAINQTGRAVECIALIMLVYLSLSLATAAAMGWLNRRAALKER